MANEVDSKIETIIISAVNRLYELESHGGLNYDDLRCFEILCKIKKDYNPGATVPNAVTDKPITPADMLELIKLARQKPDK